jgi:putative methionine-R-sulfoxide reductase with GAF domain
VTDKKNKPVLDEQTFQKLLEAAFVLQEHNREVRQMEESLEMHSEQLRQIEAETQAALQRSTRRTAEESSRPNPEYTLTLAEIVETQHQIQIRHLESDQAMAVVAERITRITHSSGAGIGIQDAKIVRYRAAAGVPALPVGSEVPLESAICAICIRTGQVLRTPDVNTEFLFDPDLCRARDIQSLVAVPVYHDGNIVGALELYFDRLNGYVEQDIHTCQLMAGLVTEALGRDAGTALKKSMAAERSSMLAAIEKLKPNLAALTDVQGNPQNSAAASSDAARSQVETRASTVCWKCGHRIIDDEQFCGKCGAPLVSGRDAASVQSKLASAIHMQQATQDASWAPSAPPRIPPNGSAPEGGTTPNWTRRAAEDTTGDPNLLPQLAPPNFEDLPERKVTGHDLTMGEAKSPPEQIATLRKPGSSDGEPVPVTLVASLPHEVRLSSGETAQDFVEDLTETSSPNALQRFWQARRGDFYLAVAVVLVLVVIRWGILSNHPVGATGSGSAGTGVAARHKSAPDSDLSAWDKLMISLGLAEAPEAPEYKGNPDTQVWIDSHTALYYCPGSELYGKTPKGRFTSQHDAQLDQFESASRKVCD